MPDVIIKKQSGTLLWLTVYSAALTAVYTVYTQCAKIDLPSSVV